MKSLIILCGIFLLLISVISIKMLTFVIYNFLNFFCRVIKKYFLFCYFKIAILKFEKVLCSVINEIVPSLDSQLTQLESIYYSKYTFWFNWLEFVFGFVLFKQVDELFIIFTDAILFALPNMLDVIKSIYTTIENVYVVTQQRKEVN